MPALGPLVYGLFDSFGLDWTETVEYRGSLMNRKGIGIGIEPFNLNEGINFRSNYREN